MKAEHANYFKALEQHPRVLVGQQVPAIGREGMETLKDAADAREWQEAVKSILAEEVRDRAGRAMEESADFMQTIHQSIELFQNNTDLIPGTKDFDTELANRFAKMAEPYEVRVEGKLQGYTIPVQPLIDSIRGQVKAERAASAAASPPASTPEGGAAAAPKETKPPADPPQAGVASKAGSSAEVEDFSTLFGTIGLPNLQI